jgi:hypothetical protein
VFATDERDFLIMLFQMASGGMICIPNLMTTGPGIQMLLGEDTHIDTQTAR